MTKSELNIFSQLIDVSNEKFIGNIFGMPSKTGTIYFDILNVLILKNLTAFT